MDIHLLFDLIAYATTAACVAATAKWIVPGKQVLPPNFRMFYFIIATTGVMVGSVFFGSLNLIIMDVKPWIAKSVLGGLIGGIVFVELMKLHYKITGSTGAVLVIGLCFGIAVGRIGCFFVGLSDYTYGIVTQSFFGVDFGDGLTRLPVQLFESTAMIILGIFCLVMFFVHKDLMLRYGFYLFCTAYAAQRFVWEFFKPYPKIFLGLNLFHYACLILFAYALVMVISSRVSHTAKYESVVST